MSSLKVTDSSSTLATGASSPPLSRRHSSSAAAAGKRENCDRPAINVPPEALGNLMPRLRDDPRFREYMRWQFISGGAFMMMGPPLFLMVSRSMTDPKLEFTLATVVVQIIPMVVSILCTQIWAPFFDRVSIFRFRVMQGFITVPAMCILCTGAVLNQLWIVAVAQFLFGITNAAGNLAWNLGHNDFAPPEKSGTYMAVNVMLTGTRGFFAPFLGIWLYEGFAGRYVFAICALCSFVGQYGFYRMSRRPPAVAPATAAKEPAMTRS